MWDVSKGIWGAIITVLTILLTYGQYQQSALTLRPHLGIAGLQSSKEVSKKYGKLSHNFAIKNFGQIEASKSSVSVLTRINGKTVHEDRDDPLGLMAPGASINYEVHVHDSHMAGYDPAKHTLLEEVRITYEGQSSLFRFWCKPKYIFTTTYKFLGEWYHDKASSEEKSCV